MASMIEFHGLVIHRQVDLRKLVQVLWWQSSHGRSQDGTAHSCPGDPRHPHTRSGSGCKTLRGAQKRVARSVSCQLLSPVKSPGSTSRTATTCWREPLDDSAPTGRLWFGSAQGRQLDPHFSPTWCFLHQRGWHSAGWLAAYTHFLDYLLLRLSKSPFLPGCESHDFKINSDFLTASSNFETQRSF